MDEPRSLRLANRKNVAEYCGDAGQSRTIRVTPSRHCRDRTTASPLPPPWLRPSRPARPRSAAQTPHLAAAPRLASCRRTTRRGFVLHGRVFARRGQPRRLRRAPSASSSRPMPITLCSAGANNRVHRGGNWRRAVFPWTSAFRAVVALPAHAAPPFTPQNRPIPRVMICDDDKLSSQKYREFARIGDIARLRRARSAAVASPPVFARRVPLRGGFSGSFSPPRLARVRSKPAISGRRAPPAAQSAPFRYAGWSNAARRRPVPTTEGQRGHERARLDTSPAQDRTTAAPWRRGGSSSRWRK